MAHRLSIAESLVNSTLDAVKGTKYEVEVKEAIALNKDAQSLGMLHQLNRNVVLQDSKLS